MDTQKVLPFGSEKEVREQVRKNAEIFSKNSGYVFNPVHNIQANVPINNIIAAFDEINQFSLHGYMMHLIDFSSKKRKVQDVYQDIIE